jgi:hypothetical protein
MGEVIAFPVRRKVPAGQTGDRRGPSSDVTELPAPQRLSSPSWPIVPPRGATSLGNTPQREPLWREVAGSVLRAERRSQQRTLAHVAGRAGMSVQYLSEVERGRKEASSEMLAAACGSLGLGLAEFARRCAGAVGAARPAGPVLLAA